MSPTKKKPATPKRAPRARKATGSTQRLRTLGGVGGSKAPTPKRSGSSATAARKARTLLQEEFRRVLAMKEKLAAESAIGGKEKGRQALRQDEKLRSLIASLEGMSRFALKMGLITPAESRELYAAAMRDGLYDGWR